MGKAGGGFYARKLLPPSFGVQGLVISRRESAQLCREIKSAGVLSMAHL